MTSDSHSLRDSQAGTWRPAANPAPGRFLHLSTHLADARLVRPDKTAGRPRRGHETILVVDDDETQERRRAHSRNAVCRPAASGGGGAHSCKAGRWNARTL